MDAFCKDTNPCGVNICKWPFISKNLELDEIKYQEDGYSQSNLLVGFVFRAILLASAFSLFNRSMYSETDSCWNPMIKM